MYSKLIVLCLAVASAVAAPAATDVVPLEKQQSTVIPIVSQSEELEPNGTYKFSYETGNGIKREETSYDKVLPKAEGRSAAGSNEGGESNESDEIHVQQGSYSYTAPDGTLISVRYIADENGFRPIGDHIPQAIVAAAAAAAGDSSSEKSGRALNVADSANSASAPAVATRVVASPAASQPEPNKIAEPAPESGKEAEKAPETPPAEATSTIEAAKPTEGSGEGETSSEVAPSTTEAAPSTTEGSPSTTEASLSTTEAVSTTNASSEASEGTTIAADVATKAADATTELSSEVPEEPSSPSADASTTEAALTASA